MHPNNISLRSSGVPLAGEVRGGCGGVGRLGRAGHHARLPARRGAPALRHAAHVRAARARGDRQAFVCILVIFYLFCVFVCLEMFCFGHLSILCRSLCVIR